MPDTYEWLLPINKNPQSPRYIPLRMIPGHQCTGQPVFGHAEFNQGAYDVRHVVDYASFEGIQVRLQAILRDLIALDMASADIADAVDHTRTACDALAAYLSP